MKIGIDIDDTITNTRELQLIFWKEYVTNNQKDGYTVELPLNINGFEDEYISVFWDTYREPLSFQASIKKDVDLITNKLREDGHTLCVVTSRPDYKYTELKKRIDNLMKKNNVSIDIIYTDVRNKGLFCRENDIDLLIDDDLGHVKDAIKNGVKAILFNRNEDYEGLQTDNWLSLYDLISQLTDN